MKIAYVANSRFPSERAHMVQMVAMCNAFVSCGHSVTLFVTDRKTHITEDLETYFGVPITFAIVRIKTPDIAGNANRIPRFLWPVSFFMQRFAFAWGAARYIQQESFDHIYGRDEWVLWLISLVLKTPSTWESHEARYSFATRRLLRKQTPFVVISEGIRDFYIEKGVSKEKILVAHDAVDDRFFETTISQTEARRELGIESSRPVVMYIGGLDAWKGVDILFTAAKLGRDVYDVYIIGGNKNEIAILEKQHHDVKFLGHKSYKYLHRYQQAADVLVIPNTAKNPLSEKYTSPLKLFSYMTSKVPIVASKIPSIMVVLGYDAAYFFEPDDATSLHRHIIDALHDSNRKVRAIKAFELSKKYVWKQRAQIVADHFSF